jgi:hypothetical protein
MDKELEALMTKAFYMRGKIISDTIYLERCMDEYMARYFSDTKEKQKDLMETLLATKRMVFENKRLIFDFVVQKANPEFLKEYPNFKKDVIFIVEQRNVVAHHLLDSSSAGVANQANQIEFINFRDGMDKTVYDLDMKANIENKLNNCIRAVQKLLG